MTLGKIFKGMLLGLLLLPAAASAAAFSGMYVFGDSLSDNGNLHDILGIPAAPYWEGRFSDGPVAAERMADALIAGGSAGSNFHDYAYGGAKTGTSAFPPGVLSQTQTLYLGSLGLGAGGADPNALYFVWGGANDLGSTSSSYTSAVNNLKTAVESLAAAGAQHILVPNLPDLSLTPKLQATGDAARIQEAHDLSVAFDSLLSTTLADLNGSLGAQVVGFDTFSLFNQVLADPSTFGFTNVSTPCFDASSGAVCANADQYLFWDDFHPTTAAHQILADQMVASVVPEPATVLLMVAGLGLIGLQLRRSRA